MGLDMLEFRKVPFHLALKRAFEHFGCEGWGIAGVDVPRPELAWQHEETWDGPGHTPALQPGESSPMARCSPRAAALTGTSRGG